MNIARRIAALKREIHYREEELQRIARLRETKEPTVTAFPDKVDEYLTAIRAGIEARLTEIRELERSR